MTARATVVGVGADAVDVAAMRRVLADSNGAFERRVLCAREADLLARARDPAVALARVFAAKEAAYKALRARAQRRLEFRSIEVLDPGARHSVVRVSPPEGAPARDSTLEVAVTIRTGRDVVSAYAVALERPGRPGRRRPPAQATRVRWVGAAHSRHKMTDGGNSRLG